MGPLIAKKIEAASDAAWAATISTWRQGGVFPQIKLSGKSVGYGGRVVFGALTKWQVLQSLVGYRNAPYKHGRPVPSANRAR